ncbi:uncharacterized protein K460DRAFT_110556 [Cucurbitaria berberidis CBS 394.84]|uniref:Uncharacterized protein n=1 Tax=Cucurbitaria berberidis CBS 394.84 TaxID=1168544 RepID=A0A9P4GGA2_9PLEO|nr:uncharacterized protein K460DRAFT_110556 [Cucurbitaria berberidis CBS 394.84]KAF1845538.1 hypothetical protein K460DRAFT_110556 [Cucurbitaria berberidis CBS 394.84]
MKGWLLLMFLCMSMVLVFAAPLLLFSFEARKCNSPHMVEGEQKRLRELKCSHFTVDSSYLVRHLLSRQREAGTTYYSPPTSPPPLAVNPSIPGFPANFSVPGSSGGSVITSTSKLGTKTGVIVGPACCL